MFIENGRGEIMKILKKIKLDMWINTIMMVLIGVLFLMNAHDSLKVISIIAGILIVCSGIFDLIYDSKLRRNTYFTYGTLFEGILKCILGIFIATHAGIMTILHGYL